MQHRAFDQRPPTGGYPFYAPSWYRSHENRVILQGAVPYIIGLTTFILGLWVGSHLGG